jgi:AcrR family transcriptional regulator
MTTPAAPRHRDRILDATISELSAHGYLRLTVEGVAGAAGIHKSTLYRWWPDKAALVADALARHLATGPIPETGNTGDDLIAWLRVTIANYTATPAGVAMPALISDLAARPDGLKAFRESFLDQRRAGCAAIIRRGITRGDLPPDTDIELLMDALAGTVFYRQLVSAQPITSDLAERIVALHGLQRAERTRVLPDQNPGSTQRINTNSASPDTFPDQQA